MRKFKVILWAVLLLLLVPGDVHAQLAVPDIKDIQRQIEEVKQVQTPSLPPSQPATVRPQQENNRGVQIQPTPVVQNENDNQDREGNNWFVGWWKIGFWTGVISIFPWIFVGRQWRRRKFWNFAWPWPWWFWIPVFWFIPWIIIGWQWWLVWWPWWVWIWWIFPWVFWPIWWLIVFKEAMIWIWKKG
ncbi:MAG: hypothetical protein AAB685_02490 [Patescibacteria group bacterium]